MGYYFKCSKNTGEYLEMSYVALWKIDRNKQNDFERLVLSKNNLR